MSELNIAASAQQKDIIDITLSRINTLEKEGGLTYPPNYSAANALRSAYLNIQDLKDRQGRPALEVCTRDSVINALLNTVIMGLNPAKKQVYYIVYGNKLEAQRSYFGTMLATKRVPGVKDIWADVVYQGDTFKISKKRGYWEILEHQSAYENIDPGKIVAAYCTIEKEDGSFFSEVMNIGQIQTSWAKSKDPSKKVHSEFPDQMAKRTVINRACKLFFNTSDDSDLLIEAFNATGEQYEDGAALEGSSPKKVDSRAAALNEEFSGGKDMVANVQNSDSI